MAKPKYIELGDAFQIPILYEDRGVIAIDKPQGWMLAPDSWQNTSRNLQLAIVSSIKERAFWAKSRNLNFLRFIHRLDADTSGVLLMARNPRVIKIYSELFESQRMEKVYLAVVSGKISVEQWTVRTRLAPDKNHKGLIRVDLKNGKDTETEFQLLARRDDLALVQARPLSGRTHQIRVHLAESGCPVLGDPLYGRLSPSAHHLALRAVSLAYPDPFTNRRIEIRAPTKEFLKEHGFLQIADFSLPISDLKQRNVVEHEPGESGF